MAGNISTVFPLIEDASEWLNTSGSDSDGGITSTLSTISTNITLENDPSSRIWTWDVILLLIFKSIIMGGIILMSVMGNGLVIVSIGLNRKLHGITNYFLLSLAIADMLVALCAMTFNASVELSGRWMFGYTICDLWNSFDVYFSTVSILHLSCISMDRYYAILTPLQYPLKMTKKRVMIMITIVWLGPILISFLPILLGWYTTADHLATRSKNVCIFEVNMIFAILSSAISFWIPCTVMLILYYKIFQEARKQETQLMSRTNSMLALHNIGRGILPTMKIRKFIHNMRTRRLRRGAKSNDSPEDRNCSGFMLTSCIRRQRSRSQSTCSAACDNQEPCQCAASADDNCKCNCPPERHALRPPCIITSEVDDDGNDSLKQSEPLRGILVNKDRGESSQSGEDGSRETGLNNGNNCKRSMSLAVEQNYSSARTSTSHHLSVNNEGLPVMRREHKAARTLGIVLGAFILCWLPFFTWYVISMICGDKCTTPQPVVTTLFWIGYFNSTLNPFIYAYYRRDFREAFMETLRRLLCCCKRETNRSFV